MICRCREREREIMYNHCQFETGKPQGFWSVSKDSCISQSRSAYCDLLCLQCYVFVTDTSDTSATDWLWLTQMARVSTWAGQLPLRLLDHGRLMTESSALMAKKKPGDDQDSFWENEQNTSRSSNCVCISCPRRKLFSGVLKPMVVEAWHSQKQSGDELGVPTILTRSDQP